MVGPCGLEPQTSAVSKGPRKVTPLNFHNVLDCRSADSAEKTELVQVKLQVKKFCADPTALAQYAEVCPFMR